MTVDSNTLLAIVAMSLATAATRLAGFVILRAFTLSPEVQRVLQAIPPSVLMAVVAPTALATGWPETIACATVAVLALRFPMLLAAATGVAVVAVLRSIG
ncbi:AzlD domain-containing protein [Ciceribacter sp. L1K22]|uniref:AzlD family protein n=1 Tax=Ciceribacter sp. L1K22 TaxID=2820275 RepID=UPI001ABEA274|nr:AzlD domain-containing protein [Ciceribacter sp. L1K22]MBO3759678.1 AzlD domain-containing protein [Ciceribacter sp. L1K22]